MTVRNVRDSNIKLGRYEHFKGGEYRVIMIARRPDTFEEMVVFQPAGRKGIWVLPANDWNEKVEKNGETYDRFKYIGE